VLHRISGGGDQFGAGTELLAPGAPPEPFSKRFGGGDDQGLELAAGVRPGGHDTGAGDMQHPQRFPVPALAWRGEMVTGQGFAAGPDGIQHIALGPVAAPGPLGPVDLDHPLTLVDQKPGQPGPIATGPFQGPHPPAWRLLVSQSEQQGMAVPVAWHRQGGPHPTVAPASCSELVARTGYRQSIRSVCGPEEDGAMREAEAEFREKAITWAGEADRALKQARDAPAEIAYAHACAALSSAYSALKPPPLTTRRVTDFTRAPER
jgi:hypothetical protein